ncbi:MAG: rhodanese-like domain-containing protein [Acidimicrobiia bacterium]|nr:rhodanese-like domain-containing protein [Acidimicrobiia bacterium]
MNSVDRLLTEARRGLRRVAVADFDAVVAEGALVVDVRPTEIRQAQGELEGALVVGLNVLEWRLAPDSPYRIVDVERDRVVVLVCQQGFSSSLAAHRLQQVGIPGATDLIGGFEALAEHRFGPAPHEVRLPLEP